VGAALLVRGIPSTLRPRPSRHWSVPLFFGLAASMYVASEPRIAFGEQLPKNLCFDEVGCTFPGPDQLAFSQRALMQLGCQPLAALRGRILYEYGMCFNDSILRALFQQKCTYSQTATDKIVKEMPSRGGWDAIALIDATERIKRCVIRD
jgi:YARHG domain